jgi:hypothetical protein
MVDELYGLGRVEKPDERDALFPLSAILPTGETFITEKLWWDDAWWGDQGQTEQCVSYSWNHKIVDGPVVQDQLVNHTGPIFVPTEFYNKCQMNDGIPGTNYGGTTVRAGAKVLQASGIIKEYRWASSIQDVVTCLLTIGPLVVGTSWFKDMFQPDFSGRIHVSGPNAGGHAYVLNGINTQTGLIRIKNSWSQSWGDRGHAYISIDDFSKLLDNGGEACMGVDLKISKIPDLNTIVNSDTR